MNAFTKDVKKEDPERYAHLPADPLLAEGSITDSDRIDFAKIELRSSIQNSPSPAGVYTLLNRSRRANPKSSPGKLSMSNEARTQHLLCRAGFGARVEELQNLRALSTEQLVEALLAEDSIPEPPGDWTSEPYDNRAFRNLTKEEQTAWRRQNRQRIVALRGWWLERMLSSPLNLLEKMTLFWHGHFTSDAQSARIAQYLFIQNDTLRRFALANFGDFLKAIYKDPAMLLYLNGVQNHAREPNENFARELMELFTLGIGNYTEADIKEAARALSGWQLDHLTLSSHLNPRRHDDGTKTFLGQTGNFDGDDIMEIILQQDATATHICRNLYEFFVSREVDEDFVQGLAATFRSNNYEIKPVLRSLFNSDHFYSDQSMASLIKSPVELAVSSGRLLSVKTMDLRYVLSATESIGQTLFSPPNVAGWPGQRVWISPTTFVTRNTFSQSYVQGGLFSNPDSRRAPIEFDSLEFAKSFGTDDAVGLAQAISDHLLRMPLSADAMNSLLPALIGSADASDWSLDYPGADRMVAAFLAQIVRLPEFHLS